jgi:hypothetical protein
MNEEGVASILVHTSVSLRVINGTEVNNKHGAKNLSNYQPWLLIKNRMFQGLSLSSSSW